MTQTTLREALAGSISSTFRIRSDPRHFGTTRDGGRNCCIRPQAMFQCREQATSRERSLIALAALISRMQYGQILGPSHIDHPGCRTLEPNFVTSWGTFAHRPSRSAGGDRLCEPLLRAKRPEGQGHMAAGGSAYQEKFSRELQSIEAFLMNHSTQ